VWANEDDDFRMRKSWKMKADGFFISFFEGNENGDPHAAQHCILPPFCHKKW